MSLLITRRTTPFRGTLTVPGDKSITHRALLFGALCSRRTVIHNYSSAADCTRTLAMLRSLAYVVDEQDGAWVVEGQKYQPSKAPLTIDCGNSGTTARLAAGFLTGERGTFTLTGDTSLSRRPMERVAAPLRQLGAQITTTQRAFPVSVIADSRIPGKERGAIAVRSAQVHGALVLAGLRSRHGVRIRRESPMRDHTLRMAGLFGYRVESDGEVDSVTPRFLTDVSDLRCDVPGDFSSAAFPIAAALLVPDSELTLQNVGLNPTRIAFLDVLRQMGADIRREVLSDSMEPVGDIHVRYSPELRPVKLGAGSRIPVSLMLDELPLLGLVASQAVGTTEVRGAEELRVKESDRITATVEMLCALGIDAEERPDGFLVHGKGAPPKGGVAVRHHNDHRLAMVAGVAGLIAESPVAIPDHQIAAVSWPEVWSVLAGE